MQPSQHLVHYTLTRRCGKLTDIVVTFVIVAVAVLTCLIVVVAVLIGVGSDKQRQALEIFAHPKFFSLFGALMQDGCGNGVVAGFFVDVDLQGVVAGTFTVRFSLESACAWQTVVVLVL
jgi:hypothetical protein